jgi:hypothetical protein
MKEVSTSLYLALRGTAVAEGWDAGRNTECSTSIYSRSVLRSARGIGICLHPCTIHCCAPFPSPGRPRQPQSGLPCGGTGDAILLGHPRTHYERQWLNEFLLLLLSFFSLLLLRFSLSSASFLLNQLCVSSAAPEKKRVPWQDTATLAKLCWGSDTTALSGFEITPTSHTRVNPPLHSPFIECDPPHSVK